MFLEEIAMMQMKIRIDKNKLMGLKNNLILIVDKELLDGGLLIEQEAKRLSPVKTGRHRDGIHLVHKLLQITISDSDDYGIFLEFGTIKMSPRPHFRPAFYKYAPEIGERIRRNIEGL